jgi:hypothetical protein
MDDFFAAMAPFLAGQTGAADVERTLGPSRSGTKRLGLYRTLVSRQYDDVLGSLFPAVRRASETHRRGLWQTLTTGYARAHPPTHWEPNRFGAHFADYLAAERERDPDSPAWLEELADFSYTRYCASVAPEPADGVGLGARVHLRRYDHDVPTYAREAQEEASGGDACRDRPEPTPVTLLIAWSHTRHRVIEIAPSLATLAALGKRVGDERAMQRHDAPSEAAVADAELQLIAHGILR